MRPVLPARRKRGLAIREPGLLEIEDAAALVIGPVVAVPLGKLRLGRACELRLGSGQFVHLGRQPPPDHRVPLVQPEPQRLTIEHLLAHPLIDAGVEFGIGRRAAHSPLEGERETRLLLAAQRDTPLRRIDRFARQGQHAPDRCTGEEKMRERIAQGAADHSASMIGGASPTCGRVCGRFFGRSQTGEE